LRIKILNYWRRIYDILHFSLRKSEKSGWHELVGILQQAIESRSAAHQPICHSDRGKPIRQLRLPGGPAQDREMRQSMSARANPYHNAWTESFIGKLKAEMLDGGCVINARDDRTEIFSYIESYYNVYCKHSALDYPTPAQLGSVQFSFLV